MYTLLCGAFPFRATNEKELYSKIIKGSFTFPDHMSQNACDLVKKILVLDPNARPTSEEVYFIFYFFLDFKRFLV